MGRKPKENTTLRNFRLPNDVFYEFEYIAQEESRDNTAQMVNAMEEAIKRYKKQNPDKVLKGGKLPLTTLRSIKIKTGAK